MPDVKRFFRSVTFPSSGRSSKCGPVSPAISLTATASNEVANNHTQDSPEGILLQEIVCRKNLDMSGYHGLR